MQISGYIEKSYSNLNFNNFASQGTAMKQTVTRPSKNVGMKNDLIIFRYGLSLDLNESISSPKMEETTASVKKFDDN